MSNPYLRELERQLQSIPEEERMELLQDYREHFSLAEAEGKSPDEIARALGDPAALAREILAEYRESKPVVNEVQPLRRKRAVWGAAAAVVAVAAIMLTVVIQSGREKGPDLAALGPEASTSPAVQDSGSQTREGSGASAAAAAPTPRATDGGVISQKEQYPATYKVIELLTVAHGIIVEPADGAEIQVRFEGRMDVKEGESWRDYYEYAAEAEGSKLRIAIKPKPGMKARGASNAVLRLALPSMKLDSLSLETISGSIAASPVQAVSLRAVTVSGGMDFARLEGDFNLHSISGSIKAEVSGWTGRSAADTVSGSISVRAEEKLPFAFELTSVSGAIECGYSDKVIEDKRKNHISGDLGDKNRSLKLSTISGKLRLEPLKVG